MLNITDGAFGNIGMHVVNPEINSESLPMSPTLVNVFAAPTQNIKHDPGKAFDDRLERRHPCSAGQFSREGKGQGSGSEKEDVWGKGSSQQF